MYILLLCTHTVLTLTLFLTGSDNDSPAMYEGLPVSHQPVERHQNIRTSGRVWPKVFLAYSCSGADNSCVGVN